MTADAGSCRTVRLELSPGRHRSIARGEPTATRSVGSARTAATDAIVASYTTKDARRFIAV